MSRYEMSLPQPAIRVPSRRFRVPRRLAVSLAIVVMLRPAAQLRAQGLPCLPERQDLVKIPELVGLRGSAGFCTTPPESPAIVYR